MNEGVFRVLRALGQGRALPRTELVRLSGESHSVISDLEMDKGKWFELRGPTVQLNDKGLAALARELVARIPLETTDALKARYLEIASQRPPVRRDLDQVFATADSVLKRARLLIERGEAQRGVLFVGDDDLTSIALRLMLDELGLDRKVRALDVDSALVELLNAHGVEALEHDVRDPLPKSLLGKTGCAFTDPPYAPEGFELFTSRAAQSLKKDGRIYVCFGWSRKSMERGLKKQRILASLGVLIEEVLADFNQYDGAESIGSVSSLWITARTPQTRPLVEGRDDRELYTRREPA